MALETLQEAKPLGPQFSWRKTKVQVFGGLLDEKVLSIHVCGEDIDILDSFKYLASVVYNNGESRQEVLRQIGLTHDARSARVSGVVSTCEDGQRFESSNRW